MALRNTPRILSPGETHGAQLWMYNFISLNQSWTVPASWGSAVSRWANHRWSRIDLLWSSLACASVVAVNVTRIVGFSVIGSRRELFPRA
jgi:hypothetical protein